MEKIALIILERSFYKIIESALSGLLSLGDFENNNKEYYLNEIEKYRDYIVECDRSISYLSFQKTHERK